MPFDRDARKPPSHLSDRDRLRWVELVWKAKRLWKGLQELDANRRIPSAELEPVVLSQERQLNAVEAELRTIEGGK